jgi:arylsulfatase A-like enzyme
MKFLRLLCTSIITLTCLSTISGEKRPNIICILVDDLGYSDLSSFGGKDIKTPAIDKLMNSGMRMNQFYANCNVCTPTRASLLTGRYPDLVGAPGVIRQNPESNWGILQPRQVPRYLNL